MEAIGPLHLNLLHSSLLVHDDDLLATAVSHVVYFVRIFGRHQIFCAESVARPNQKMSPDERVQTFRYDDFTLVDSGLDKLVNQRLAAFVAPDGVRSVNGVPYLHKDVEQIVHFRYFVRQVEDVFPFVQQHAVHFVDNDGSGSSVTGNVAVGEEATQQNVPLEAGQVAVDDVGVIPSTAQLFVLRTGLVTIVFNADAKYVVEPFHFGDVSLG